LRAKRSNPSGGAKKEWIASSQVLLAMTMVRGLGEIVMRKAILAMVALLAFCGPAAAQNYPSHPITIIVPFSAGGPSDAMSRILPSA
jgi:hypothetical protein